MELYLIRHPRPQVAPGTCYGQLDLPLAEDPVQIAAGLRPLLPARYSLHASPLQRARLLAEALGQPALDPRLMEIHFGEWEGRSYDSIGSARWPPGSMPGWMGYWPHRFPPPWWSPTVAPCAALPAACWAFRRNSGWPWILRAAN